MNKKQMKKIRKIMAGEDKSMLKLAKTIYKQYKVLPKKKENSHVAQ